MLTKAEFIAHVLGEVASVTTSFPAADRGHVEGFDFESESTEWHTTDDTRFVTPLLQAAFGQGQNIPRSSVIRSADAVARHIPDQIRYWPKTTTCHHHTLLIELTSSHTDLLNIPAFRSRNLAHLNILEDALTRVVTEVLEGFQRGAGDLGASALKAAKHETLCVVTIADKREGELGYLACFGTFDNEFHGLETFFISRPLSTWDRTDARERLSLIYERQFRTLGSPQWQEAFTTSQERELATRLLRACTGANFTEARLQEHILDLLDTIARGFGLRKEADAERRLLAYTLPSEHDIGMDSEEREGVHGGVNPFSGVALRDEHHRLLGYIIYPLNSPEHAKKLRQHLEKHNRFHNVLVVYPDANQANIELWQGREQLTGKLRKGQSHRDAADVVNLLSRFFVVSKAKVRNPAELAQELAYRARYLRRLALRQLQDETDGGALQTLYADFRKALVHDLTKPDFADAFAQTLTYSLLTARWVQAAQNKPAPAKFERTEAMKRLSLGSRFLSEMFQAVLSMRLDDRSRLLWLVDDVADLLDRIDIVAVFKPDGTDLTSDPILHFYEPFLAAYDAKVRMKRGAFYTPKPVVSYIVRSVHELLQTKFGLEDGLADTTTWGEMLKRHPALKLPPLTDQPGETRTISPEEPFVQILDPATGTATFVVEVIDVIYRTLTAKWNQQRLTDAEQRGAWNEYVPKHLLSRIFAYELMMAPYAIAHMKIGLKLAETGYEFGTNERACIYLTNALEPWLKQLPLIGFDALANEAAAVNEIKRQKRFTVLIGNPPYAGYSANEGQWIEMLMEDYKKTVRNEERQIQRLSNDYVKFIRFSEATLLAAGTGCLGLITDSSYLNGILFRDMRSALRSSFECAWIFDLHGAAMRGAQRYVGIDENVFDITQGVVISLFVKLDGATSEFGHADLVGGRKAKYGNLSKDSVLTTPWSPLRPSLPKCLFVPMSSDDDYEAWPLFIDMVGTGSPNHDRDSRYGTGIKTRHDDFVVAWTPDEAVERVKQIENRPESDGALIKELGLCTTAHFSIRDARRRSQAPDLQEHVRPIAYRPFDTRWLVYLREFVCEPKTETMRHMLHPQNVALAVLRRDRKENGAGFFVARGLIAKDMVSNLDDALVWPLYLLPDEGQLLQEPDGRAVGAANIARKTIAMFTSRFKLTWCEYGSGDLSSSIGPEDIFHYFYAILNSPAYRDRYAEFLKIDFPRLPLTGNLQLFRELARLGGELTSLHVLESPKLHQPFTDFIGVPNSEVSRIAWVDHTVFIDAPTCKRGATQAHGKVGFAGVSEAVWNFHIGGYQVCEKWLKDRKGRRLTPDDILHYQRIVVALSETIRLMNEIDQVIETHGGWPNAFAAKETE
jgi:hypothetical protein